jgi:hypothetical protein
MTANIATNQLWESDFKKIGSPKLWDCTIKNTLGRTLHLYSTDMDELHHVRYLLSGIDTNEYALQEMFHGRTTVITTPIFNNNPLISPQGNILECAVARALDKYPEHKVFVGDVSGIGVIRLLQQFHLESVKDIVRVGAIPVTDINVYTFESFIKNRDC